MKLSRLIEISRYALTVFHQTGTQCAAFEGQVPHQLFVHDSINWMEEILSDCEDWKKGFSQNDIDWWIEKANTYKPVIEKYKAGLSECIKLLKEVHPELWQDGEPIPRKLGGLGSEYGDDTHEYYGFDLVAAWLIDSGAIENDLGVEPVSEQELLVFTAKSELPRDPSFVDIIRILFWETPVRWDYVVALTPENRKSFEVYRKEEFPPDPLTIFDTKEGRSLILSLFDKAGELSDIIAQAKRDSSPGA